MIITDSLAANTAVALRSDVVATVLDDGAVLLDLESKYFYQLNPSGWAIAQVLESGASAAELQRRCAQWDAPDDGSVLRFVEQLAAFGLLEPVDAPPTSDAPTEVPRPWMPPTVERQAEPLQQVIVSAFDPSIPLAE